MPRTTSNVDDQDRILAEELSSLDRPPYLLYFRELRDNNISYPYLNDAANYLYEDAYSTKNRIWRCVSY
jgi:hypothetical protein